ncbi:hypothetical protein CQW23_25094 [Capsicum baccatum]|uniref:Uncharacterized protein n=1 Tax=Capsicum baccatum TaxID=33114 RepID=A0A2G2VJZ1_CAPBA|nr:hypothetical protein CQW23_25094 [Capsicum baccatum]
MDLDNIKSNLIALRQLYGLLRNDSDGVSNLNSDGFSCRGSIGNSLSTSEAGVRSAHATPSPDPTLWNYTGYVVVVLVIGFSCRGSIGNNLSTSEAGFRGSIGYNLSTSEAGARSMHAAPSPGPTLWNYTGYVVVVLVIGFSCRGSIGNNLSTSEAGVRSAHATPSPDPTLWNYTGYVVVVLVIGFSCRGSIGNNLSTSEAGVRSAQAPPSPEPTLWNYTDYVVVVLVIGYSCRGFIGNSLSTSEAGQSWSRDLETYVLDKSKQQCRISPTFSLKELTRGHQLDHEARVMLKNLLDATTNDVLKAHFEIIARQVHVHSLPQPQQPVDAVKQQPVALLDVSKSSAGIQSYGKEPVVVDPTLSKEKQEPAAPITQTASALPPKFSFSAGESGKKRKFCRICQLPKVEKPFVKEAPCSTKVVALQEQQKSPFANFSWDIQRETLQSGNTESTEPKEVLHLRCITSGAETVVPSLSERPASDLTQSAESFSGLKNRDHLSTDDAIKQLELHIAALQMDAEDLVLADKHAAEHNFKPVTHFVPQVELASPVKKIEGDVVNDSLQLVITRYSQEPKGASSSLYPGYTIPIRISNISADQSPKPPESSSCQSNQLRQQKIVANIFPAEEHDSSTELDLVEEHPRQIQRGNITSGQSIQSIDDRFESLSRSKNQNNSTSRQNPYANSYSFQQDRHNMEAGGTVLPAMLVNQNQNQMPSNTKIRQLEKLKADRQMRAADISRNNIGTPGLIDHGGKLTWSGTDERRMDSPYSQRAIMRRSALNHKLRQFTPSRSSYANLDQNSSKYPKNSNHMKRLRRGRLHEQESEVSHLSSPYSSSSTDLQQRSTYSSDNDDSLPRQARAKMQYSDETSSYGGDESYPRRGSSQSDYTLSSSYSGNEGYSSSIGSEKAHESEGERSSSLDPSGSDRLEEPSYYSADSSSRRSSPARVYKSANSEKSKKHNGRWKKLKDKLAVVFHHHHHHHHHHRGKDEKKTTLARQRGKRFPGHYSSSKDEAFGEKALEKFGKSAIDKQAGKKPKGGDQFHTLARGLMQHIQHSKKSKHSSTRPVDKEQHSNKKAINKFHWWQLLRHHRGMNKSPAMLGSRNKKGHSKAFPR